jgi:acyl-CoA thioesterase-1
MSILAAAPAIADPIRIVAFGGSSIYGANVERTETYRHKLEQALRAGGHDVAVANAGVNGDKTSDGLARMNRAIPAGTQIVLVEYGVNDKPPAISRYSGPRVRVSRQQRRGCNRIEASGRLHALRFPG